MNADKDHRLEDRRPEGCVRRIGSRQGVTLVEVVVAMFILGITLGAGVQALISYRRVAESANRQIEAVHAARAELEALTRKNFYDSDLDVGTHSLSEGKSYTVSRIPPSDSFSKLKLISVSIPWVGGVPGQTGAAPRETLSTVISEALH